MYFYHLGLLEGCQNGQILEYFLLRVPKVRRNARFCVLFQ